MTIFTFVWFLKFVAEFYNLCNHENVVLLHCGIYQWLKSIKWNHRTVCKLPMYCFILRIYKYFILQIYWCTLHLIYYHAWSSTRSAYLWYRRITFEFKKGLEFLTGIAYYTSKSFDAKIKCFWHVRKRIRILIVITLQILWSSCQFGLLRASNLYWI